MVTPEEFHVGEEAALELRERSPASRVVFAKLDNSVTIVSSVILHNTLTNSFIPISKRVGYPPRK